MKKLLFLIFVVIVVWKFSSDGEVVLGPGVKITDVPIQQDIIQPKDFDFKDHHITPLAEFQITAKVLARKNYYRGRESDLSPVDFALGWQQMSDESVLSQIDISQSGRWYRWHVEQFPIPRKDIETQSANMHMIPANDLVGDMLDLVKKGQVIELKGYLVRVEADDGWYWQSSLTRDDVGGHACEVIYVESVQVLQ